MTETLKNCLRDTLPILIEMAREVAKEVDTAKQQGAIDDWTNGRLSGWHESISILVEQLNTFGISLEELGVPSDFDADNELLK